MENLTIALAGNPNVGKSTIFNALTGMHQHTGNWAGKTVANAYGEFNYFDTNVVLADIPGTYSLFANSDEEKVARDFICFSDIDGVIIVCDATCLERNLNLVLQILEITSNVVLCINLIDEAEKKSIKINIEELSAILNVPIVCTCAKKKIGIEKIKEKASEINFTFSQCFNPDYPSVISDTLNIIKSELTDLKYKNKDWLSIRILENDPDMICAIKKYLKIDNELFKIYQKLNKYLYENNLTYEKTRDIISTTIIKKSEEISKAVITYKNEDYKKQDIAIDKILTGKASIPIMIFTLLCILWITIEGANYPSQLLSLFFEKSELFLYNIMQNINLPYWLSGILLNGIYRTLGWVVSVMLPPMAIFFPLFTILEDLGYLPRIAFNLDKCFKCCGSCGKQALTMCMGFGCNAVGVVGCRIIGSKRERLIAMLTNSFMPCNGRFPMIISIMTMFFVTGIPSPLKSLFSAIFLTALIIMSIAITFIVSLILSKTLLKGIPSSFTLELPPYRIPQFCKVLIYSVIDRTLKILMRAVLVAIPSGAILWILANTHIESSTLLSILVSFFTPFAHLMGLDGEILTGFILGIPANETVVPITLMAYLSEGALSFDIGAMQTKQIFLENGWTFITALCTIMFAIFHWPCSTTILTIYKESKSLKWTFASIILPTLLGILICVTINTIYLVLKLFI